MTRSHSASFAFVIRVIIHILPQARGHLFALALSLLLGRQWPAIGADPWFIVGTAVLLLVAVTAQALKPAKIELGSITFMRLDVVNDFGRPHKVDSKAPLAQRLAHELASPNTPPSSIIVGATSGIAALAAALWM